MIVSELIKTLTELPQDYIVLGRGYEDGYDAIEDVDVETLVKCANAWYDGEFQEPESPMGTPIEASKEYICLT